MKTFRNPSQNGTYFNKFLEGKANDILGKVTRAQ
jgi:hypothetical protein